MPMSMFIRYHSLSLDWYNLQKSEPRVKKVHTLVGEGGTNCHDKKERLNISLGLLSFRFVLDRSFKFIRTKTYSTLKFSNINLEL